MTHSYPVNSAQNTLKTRLLDFFKASTPPPTSSLNQSIHQIQHGIKATLDGLSKDWLNVQPCVLHGLSTLVEFMQNHERRLGKVEEDVEAIRQTVQHLLNDTRLKEERYELDRAMQDEAVIKLNGLTERLHLTLKGGTGSHRQLKHEVRRLERDIHNLGKKYDQLSTGAGILASTQARNSFGRQQEENSDKLHEELMQEIHLLRSEWQKYRLAQEESTSLSCRKDHKVEMDFGTNRHISLVQDMKLFVPLQRARWVWMAERGSHFSAALTRNTKITGKSVSLPILWEEVQFYEADTGRWYTAEYSSYESLRSVAYNRSTQRGYVEPTLRTACAHRQSNSRRSTALYKFISKEEDARGRKKTRETPVTTEEVEPCNWFDWVRPKSIRIMWAGIYKYTTCLLREIHASSLFSGGVGTAGEGLDREILVLYVNHRPVANLVGNSSFVSLHTSSPTTPPSTMRDCSASHGCRARCLSAQPGLLARRSTRTCCEPEQFATSTFSDYIFLPEGAIVQVCCHNMHNTKVIYEAFLELEYIV